MAETGDLVQLLLQSCGGAMYRSQFWRSKPMKLSALTWACLVAVAIFLTDEDAHAQTSLAEDTLDVVSADKERAFGFRAGSFILAPIPFSNPTIGNGFAGGGAWLFTTDSGSTTS